MKKTEVSKDADLHEIYLAGGCFWGVEEYFSRVPGVTDAVSGYANGRGETTKYELINQTGHAETVHVTYDAKQISLKEILLHYLRIIWVMLILMPCESSRSVYCFEAYCTPRSEWCIMPSVLIP